MSSYPVQIRFPPHSTAPGLTAFFSVPLELYGLASALTLYICIDSIYWCGSVILLAAGMRVHVECEPIFFPAKSTKVSMETSRMGVLVQWKLTLVPPQPVFVLGSGFQCGSWA